MKEIFAVLKKPREEFAPFYEFIIVMLLIVIGAGYYELNRADKLVRIHSKYRVAAEASRDEAQEKLRAEHREQARLEKQTLQ